MSDHEGSPKNETLPEPQKSKKENSYTYWTKNEDPNFYNKTNIDIKPKKVEDNDLQKIQ